VIGTRGSPRSLLPAHDMFESYQGTHILQVCVVVVVVVVVIVLYDIHVRQSFVLDSETVQVR